MTPSFPASWSAPRRGKPNGPGHSDLIDAAQLSVERFAEGKLPSDPTTTLTSGGFDNQGSTLTDT
jgi:hypothetical protein